MDGMQVHYPLEAIQNASFSDSKLQLLELQVNYFKIYIT